MIVMLTLPVWSRLIFHPERRCWVMPIKETQAVMGAIREMLDELGLGMDRIVRTDVHLANIVHFDEMDRAYREFFEAGRYPARTTVESPNMFGGSLVEVTCMARLNPT